ncbi:MAG TPA: VOC family protein [Bryobacteraceae bacterium]|nr:VOC family protein [Bryobacteraceae bacterium]
MDLPLKFHHIGYVVPSIAATLEGFIRSLGAQWDGCVFEDPHQKVKVTFLATRPGDPQIELVEPAGGDSPVLRFLREKGGGLHHACYEVEDLERSMGEFKSRGALIARRPKPAVAFEGRRIAWVLTAEKLLVELLESRGAVSR